MICFSDGWAPSASSSRRVNNVWLRMFLWRVHRFERGSATRNGLRVQWRLSSQETKCGDVICFSDGCFGPLVVTL